MTAGGPRILYLYSMIAANGRDHFTNRRLVDLLRASHEVVAKWGIYPDDAWLEITDQVLSAEVIPDSEFFDPGFDVVIIEDNLGSFGEVGHPKVRVETFREHVRRGGAILYLVGDANIFSLCGSVRAHNAYMERAGLPPFWLVHAGEGTPPVDFDQYVFGYDEQTVVMRRGRRSGYFTIEIDDAYVEGISRHFREAFVGCRRLVMDHHPLHLNSLGLNTILTGNPKSTHLLTSGDHRFGDAYRPVFGAGHERLGGPIVTLTGDICHDVTLDAAPSDNLRFVSNLVALLLEHGRERKRLLGLHPRGATESDDAARGFEADVEIERVIERLSAADRRLAVDDRLRADAEELLGATLREIWGSCQPRRELR